MNAKEICILVIDDEPEMAELVALILATKSFRVITAVTGLDGLAKAKQFKPNLIVLDIMMPDMDGYEVCKRLKADEETAVIPVLFLSALGSNCRLSDEDDFGNSFFADPADRSRGFEVGAIDYLSKPVAARDLIQHVKFILWSEGFGEFDEFARSESNSQIMGYWQGGKNE